jgi:hypothetical protein
MSLLKFCHFLADRITAFMGVIPLCHHHFIAPFFAAAIDVLAT